MFRFIENDLIEWKNQIKRKPLLVRGARQVGKSYIIEKFGRNHFKQLIIVNFELEPKFISCFDSLDPEKIIRAIEIISKKDVVIGETLLFFDEIQQCPEAILALRYFKEQLQALHVIAAGSFLEFIIHADCYQQPVGRVQSLYMKPCSFNEYLIACGEHRLLDYLSSATIKSGIEQAIHELLLEKCREYFILGGMPEVIDYYVTTRKLLGCEKMHASILEYYQRDLIKYRHRVNAQLLEKVFIKAPRLIAEHVKYVDIDPDVQARDLKPVITTLIKAGVIYPIYHSSANGLPLQAGINEKKFKLLFLDIGLAKYTMGLDVETLLNEHLILMNQGNLAEQFVGQELLAYGKNYEEGRLFYWEREKRGSQAEVDYVITIGPHIVPVEVKSGRTGKLKSLHVFLQEKRLKIGVRISQNQLSFERSVLSVPLYMVQELPRLLRLFI